MTLHQICSGRTCVGVDINIEVMESVDDWRCVRWQCLGLPGAVRERRHFWHSLYLLALPLVSVVKEDLCGRNRLLSKVPNPKLL